MEKESDYIWCLHCECVYHRQKWEDNRHTCPSCGAPRLIDRWNWSRVVDVNDYPDIPEEGKEYPLYPK